MRITLVSSVNLTPQAFEIALQPHIREPSVLTPLQCKVTLAVAGALTLLFGIVLAVGYDPIIGIPIATIGTVCYCYLFVDRLRSQQPPETYGHGEPLVEA